MEFEQLIKKIENVMMPELQRRADALISDSRFKDVRIASLRHAEAIHTIGLYCHPITSPSPDEGYSIGVNIFSVNKLGMRGFVTWSQPHFYIPIKGPSEVIEGYNKQSGYTIHEGMTRPFNFQPGETAEDFILLLPASYKTFDRGVRRGSPPREATQGLESLDFLGEIKKLHDSPLN